MLSLTKTRADQWRPIDTPNHAIIDARSLASFTSGHIPGARLIESAQLRACINGIDGQVVSTETTQSLMQDHGIKKDTPVLIYGDKTNPCAARVLWTLAYSGHRAALVLLDGGFDGYVSAGGALGYGPNTEISNEQDNTNYTQIDKYRVDKNWILGQLNNPDVILIDVRSDADYALSTIPGSIHVNWVTSIDANGYFLSNDDLRKLYGPNEDKIIVPFCRSGHRAAVTWFILMTLGYKDVRLYDGSWLEWSADSVNPQNKSIDVYGALNNAETG